jgi:hypothetical protein
MLAIELRKLVIGLESIIGLTIIFFGRNRDCPGCSTMFDALTIHLLINLIISCLELFTPTTSIQPAQTLPVMQLIQANGDKQQVLLQANPTMSYITTTTGKLLNYLSLILLVVGLLTTLNTFYGI